MILHDLSTHYKGFIHINLIFCGQRGTLVASRGSIASSIICIRMGNYPNTLVVCRCLKTNSSTQYRSWLLSQ